eukprot:6066777-Amphidinium_carterae.1
MTCRCQLRDASSLPLLCRQDSRQIGSRQRHANWTNQQGRSPTTQQVPCQVYTHTHAHHQVFALTRLYPS